MVLIRNKKNSPDLRSGLRIIRIILILENLNFKKLIIYRV